ncbi:cytochrome b/b6 domain-containing protein [Tsuneonella troitsensis]|uniref:cytochrome b/b6 domain-containing protein n=1 Tax=Tsuneonella troitsensis TaxID=292222 RepID=UPI0007090D5F|nr:cytochrome b/b6 domain-containing protein [Tsuneonella troitsensis]
MKRHALSTRLWHWINLVCVVILFMSGLNISNAHPRLYWGDWGFAPEDAWLIVPRFPDWMTIPGRYSLAGAREWHVLMAWPFALGLLLVWIAMLANRHFSRDLTTSRAEWRWSAIRSDIAKHLRLDFHHSGSKFNFLQKLAYGLVFGVLLPGLIATGMGISPGMEPLLSPMIELVGGRQSVRSLHFIFAWLLFGFFVVHVLLVLLSNPFRQLRDMITGGRDGA